MSIRNTNRLQSRITSGPARTVVSASRADCCCAALPPLRHRMMASRGPCATNERRSPCRCVGAREIGKYGQPQDYGSCRPFRGNGCGMYRSRFHATGMIGLHTCAFSCLSISISREQGCSSHESQAVDSANVYPANSTRNGPCPYLDIIDQTYTAARKGRFFCICKQ